MVERAAMSRYTVVSLANPQTICVKLVILAKNKFSTITYCFVSFDQRAGLERRRADNKSVCRVSASMHSDLNLCHECIFAADLQ
jgi:hypothetical protein